VSKWDYPGCEIPGNTESSKQRKARRKRQKNEARFGDQELRDYVHRLPCCVSGGHPTEAAHLAHAGMGGTDSDRHTDNIVPLVRDLHHELDRVLGRREFERRHRIDLAGIARVVTEGFKNNWPPEEIRRQWKEYGGR